MAWRVLGFGLAVGVGCGPSEAPGPAAPPEDPGHDMPEASAPVTQSLEDGPVAEGFYDRAGLEAGFASDGEGGFASLPLTLPAPSSRATVWLRLDDPLAAAPAVQVQAGWTSGQTGPWVALEEVWSEAGERIFAADLDTAATRIQLRLGDLSGVQGLRWAANVPLDAARRGGAVGPVEARPGSVVGAPATYGAQAARCAVPQSVVEQVVLHRAPADALGGDPDRYLRALQAFDLHGLAWCDLRANYVVGAGAPRMGRGPRVGALAATEAGNRGLAAIAALGCEAPGPETQDDLTALLDELTADHGLTSGAQFSVGGGGACPGVASSWLDEALADWLETAPFVVVPPPPVTTGTLRGRVFDASTGDVTTGAGIEGARVRCECGLEATSGADGAFTLTDVPQGTDRWQASKAGWVGASAEVTVVAEDTVDVGFGLEPEPEPPAGVSVIDHAFLITHFGGVNADPLNFAQTQDGFQDYLDAVGVTYFAAWEYVVPNNPSVAQGCGYTILLPDRSQWPKAAALGLLADQLRALVNEPVTLRNWWRPPCYNEGVGGAAGGDHPDADALDLDFRSARSRADAQRYLCETYWLQDIVPPEDIEPGSGLNPRLNMSVGLGGVTIHLGLLSRNGRRFWQYSSYTNESNSGTCW